MHAYVTQYDPFFFRTVLLLDRITNHYQKINLELALI